MRNGKQLRELVQALRRQLGEVETELADEFGEEEFAEPFEKAFYALSDILEAIPRDYAGDKCKPGLGHPDDSPHAEAEALVKRVLEENEGS